MREKYLHQRKSYLKTIGIDEVSDDNTLMAAFTHKSFAMDYTHEMSHHERLEFLGDAILGSCIATMLYLHFPTATEATLSLYKIALVREETLALVGKSIGLNKQILLSHGEEGSNGRNKPAIISDCLEALLGMIALSFGYESAYLFIEKNIFCLVDNIQDFLPIKSAKSRVQEYSQGLHKQLPTYTDEVAQTDNHNNPILFASSLAIDGKIVARATGSSKKKAQEAAAALFLDKKGS